MLAALEYSFSLALANEIDSDINIYSSSRYPIAHPRRRPPILFPQHRLADYLCTRGDSHGPICTGSTVRLSSHYRPSYRYYNAPCHILHDREMFVATKSTSTHYHCRLNSLHLPQHRTHGHSIFKTQSNLSLRRQSRL